MIITQKLFSPTPKHEAIMKNSSLYKLLWGSKITAKTKAVITAGFDNCVKYFGYIFIISRVTIPEFKDSIFPLLEDIQFSFPVYWNSVIKKINRTDRTDRFFNQSVMKLIETNHIADRTLKKWKGSIPFNGLLLDEISSFHPDVLDIVGFNAGRQPSYNQVGLHQHLVDQGYIKKSLLHDYHHLSFQHEILEANSKALSRFDMKIQLKIKAPFSAPTDIWCTSNPVNRGKWSQLFIDKTDENGKALTPTKAKKYFAIHFNIDDNKDFLNKEQIDFFKNATGYRVIIARGSSGNPQIDSSTAASSVILEKTQLISVGHEGAIVGEHDTVITGSWSIGSSDLSTPISANPTDKLAFGEKSDLNGLNFAGDIFEILVYDKYLNQSERNEVRTYLVRKYGI